MTPTSIDDSLWLPILRAILAEYKWSFVYISHPSVVLILDVGL